MKLRQPLRRDLLWLLVIAGLLLGWLYREMSLRERLAAAENTLSNLAGELASFKGREADLAQQEAGVAATKERYTALIKDVDIVKRKCESILDDYADLKGKPRLGITGSLE